MNQSESHGNGHHSAAKWLLAFILGIVFGMVIFLFLHPANPTDTSKANAAARSAVFTPSPKPPSSSSFRAVTVEPQSQTYILNTNTKVFHKPSCSSVNQMLDKNKRTYTGPRQTLIDQNYKPCGRCHP